MVVAPNEDEVISMDKSMRKSMRVQLRVVKVARRDLSRGDSDFLDCLGALALPIPGSVACVAHDLYKLTAHVMLMRLPAFVWKPHVHIAQRMILEVRSCEIDVHDALRRVARGTK